ncbi:unnamed protein product, partial [marine sediment metagenome]
AEIEEILGLNRKWSLALVGAGETVAVLLIYKILPGWLLIGSLPILPSLIVATLTLVVVSYLTTPPSPKRIAKFFDLFDSVFQSSDETN